MLILGRSSARDVRRSGFDPRLTEMEDQSKTVSAVNLATDPTKAGIGKSHQLDFQINSLLAMEYSGEKRKGSGPVKTDHASRGVSLERLII
jgi:hypothetical protein